MCYDTHIELKSFIAIGLDLGTNIMKMDFPEEKVLWQDRKRYLGLPISFTRYFITAKSLTIKTGLFSTRTEDILLYRILDSSMHRKMTQKMFGVGTIELHTADRSAPEVNLINVREPRRVRRLLSQLVEDERLRQRVATREMYGDFGSMASEAYDFDGDGYPDL